MMPPSQDYLVAVVTKLRELTRSHVITWIKSATLPTIWSDRFASTPLHSKISFETTYEGRVLRITRYDSPGGIWFGDVMQKYALDVCNLQGNIIFEFPEIEGLRDLFRSVETERLDIEGFIRNLVG